MSVPKEIADSYIALLQHELAAAQGCTEPIAIAYAAALCTKTLGEQPTSLHVCLSGNIIKNARCAVVPNTGGLRGMKAAAVAGAVGGEASRELEVISDLAQGHIAAIRNLAQGEYCKVSLLDTPETLHILIEAEGSAGNACTVEIKHAHTRVHCITKNGEVLFSAEDTPVEVDEDALYEKMNLEDIYRFASEGALTSVEALLEKQIAYNIAICEEGLTNHYGAGVGRLLLETGGGVEARACAYAAAGSDARMSGCPMPVVINSGSGNQGITVTAPVWVYARFLNAPQEQMRRALLLSNLVALYQKKQIGKLSAYCGAVSAACGAAAAITYLHGGSKEQVYNTLSNATVTISGMLCDGAKPSCASKIAAAVYTGLLGHKMSMAGCNLLPGDGLVGADITQTVWNVGHLASQGLQEIDKMMLQLMLEQHA